MPQNLREPHINWANLRSRPFVTVTPGGPDDGGDFGPYTVGTSGPTQTCGIQEAINSLRYYAVGSTQYGGGQVRIQGTLNLPSTTPGIVLYPGIGLVGQGALDAFQYSGGTGGGTSFISIPTSANVPVISVEVDPNFTGLTTFPYVADLSISGIGAASSGQHGIYVNNVNGTINDFFMSHVLIFSVGGNGLYINNAGKHYFYDCYMEDNLLAGVTVAESSVMKISRCYVFGNGNQGIYFSDATAGTGYRSVDNCEIWNNGFDGLNAGGSSGNANDTMLSVTNCRFQNNGGSSTYNNILLYYQPNFFIGGNYFVDNRGTKLTGYHIYVNDSRTTGVIQGNNFSGSALSGYIQWNVGAAANIVVKDNVGYNPVGLMASPWETGLTLVGIQSSTFGSSAPTASTAYTMSATDAIIYSTGGTGVSITIKDNAGNTVASGLTTLTAYYLPRQWTINFGGFSVAPTTKVYII